MCVCVCVFDDDNFINFCVSALVEGDAKEEINPINLIESNKRREIGGRNRLKYISISPCLCIV